MALKNVLINILHRTIRFGASTVWSTHSPTAQQHIENSPHGNKLQCHKNVPICVSDARSFKLLCNLLKNISKSNKVVFAIKPCDCADTGDDKGVL